MNNIENIWRKIEKCEYKISTDTRKDISGSVFFALKGESFDGNKFVKEALKNGAVCVVSDNPKNQSKKVYIVKNSLETLQKLALRYRKLFNIPTIVIGGSNGKTTSKDLIKEVLKTKYKVHSTESSFNNHFGVPLTIFAMSKDTEIAIFEIGANHPKEHTELLKIICPTHVVVTNNGMDHLEGFGSPNGVRKANKEIYDWAEKNNCLVFVNKNYSDLLKDSKNTHRILYPERQIEKIKYETNLVGEYNKENILLALSIGEYFKVNLEKAVKAIGQYEPISKRSQYFKKNDINFVLDCYNANPSSMKLSLQSFCSYSKKPNGVILGDMLELGKYSDTEHKKIVNFVFKQKLDYKVFIGNNFKKALKNKISYHWFANSLSARDWFWSQNFNGYNFLLKGSRGIKVENVLEKRTKKISEIVHGLKTLKIIGIKERKISDICFDSRKTKEGSLFVAIKGVNDDGNKFIGDAIKNGSKVIVQEKPVKNIRDDITYILVKNSRSALSKIAQNFYDNPSQKIKLVGVTGTNGKTTTATILYKTFRLLGHSTALISTIENKINDQIFPTIQTTPDPVSLSEFLNLAVANGCQYAFMECSSHAIDQKRIEGLSFAVAIFTNLTHDHLDYHKTLMTYAETKKKLFDNLAKNSFALANADDPKARFMLKNTKAKKYFLSLQKPSNFKGNITSQSLDGLKMKINGKEIKTKMIGKFNAYNILGVLATTKLLNLTEHKVISNLKKLSAPEGRMDFLKSKNGVYGVIDYAHTPDALKSVLKTLTEIKNNEAKIITVVGCGGDRDKTKRPIMGKIACSLSDHVIFTADNSRSESTIDIIRNITVSLKEKNFESIENRAEAIKKACKMAKPKDVVLIAGKGHEKYQTANNKTIYFSDMDELKKNFKRY